MRASVIVSCLLFVTVFSYAQEKKALPPIVENPSEQEKIERQAANPPEKVIEMWDLQKAPVFPGGEAALKKYFEDNIVYPEVARQNGIKGVVVLGLLIDKSGVVREASIIKDLGGGTGKEAVRVAMKMPAWSPGEAGGQPVAVRYTLPVKFQLPAKK